MNIFRLIFVSPQWVDDPNCGSLFPFTQSQSNFSGKAFCSSQSKFNFDLLSFLLLQPFFCFKTSKVIIACSMNCVILLVSIVVVDIDLWERERVSRSIKQSKTATSKKDKSQQIDCVRIKNPCRNDYFCELSCLYVDYFICLNTNPNPRKITNRIKSFHGITFLVCCCCCPCCSNTPGRVELGQIGSVIRALFLWEECWQVQKSQFNLKACSKSSDRVL